MQIRFLCIALVALATGSEVYGSELGQSVPPATIVRSSQHFLASTAVGDSFVIQVRLPASYARSNKKYSVLYILDGDKCFGLASDTADWLAWAREAPEIIVVGIAYVQERDWWEKRSRDLTPTKDASKVWGEFPRAGGAAKFQSFLLGELFPFIESHYRALPSDRAIAGISFGGLFGAFSLFTHPTMFQRYILIAPTFVWDNRRLWQYEAEYQANSQALSAIVFTAVGEKDDSTTILTPWSEFNRVVENRHYTGLHWLTQIFPDESHISVLPGALSRGIRSIYRK